MDGFHINDIVRKWFPAYIKASIIELDKSKENSNPIAITIKEYQIANLLDNHFPEISDFILNFQYKNKGNFWTHFFQMTQWHPHEDFYVNKIFIFLVNKTLNNQECFEHTDSDGNTIWHNLLQNNNIELDKKILIIQQWHHLTKRDFLFKKNNKGVNVFDMLSLLNNWTVDSTKIETLRILSDLIPLEKKDEQYFLNFINKNDLSLLFDDSFAEMKGYYKSTSEKNQLKDDLNEHNNKKQKIL